MGAVGPELSPAAVADAIEGPGGARRSFCWPPALYQLLCVFLCGGIMFSEGSEMLVMGAVTRLVSQHWEVSATLRGGLVSCVFIGFAMGNLASGRIGDTFGRRRSILISYGMIGVFGALTASAGSILTLLLLRFCVGVGCGLGFPAVYALIAEVSFARFRGLTSTLMIGFMPLGELFAALGVWAIDNRLDGDSGSMGRLPTAGEPHFAATAGLRGSRDSSTGTLRAGLNTTLPADCRNREGVLHLPLVPAWEPSHLLNHAVLDVPCSWRALCEYSAIPALLLLLAASWLLPESPLWLGSQTLRQLRAARERGSRLSSGDEDRCAEADVSVLVEEAKRLGQRTNVEIAFMAKLNGFPTVEFHVPGTNGCDTFRTGMLGPSRPASALMADVADAPLRLPATAPAALAAGSRSASPAGSPVRRREDETAALVGDKLSAARHWQKRHAAVVVDYPQEDLVKVGVDARDVLGASGESRVAAPALPGPVEPAGPIVPVGSPSGSADLPSGSARSASRFERQWGMPRFEAAFLAFCHFTKDFSVFGLTYAFPQFFAAVEGLAPGVELVSVAALTLPGVLLAVVLSTPPLGLSHRTAVVCLAAIAALSSAALTSAGTSLLAAGSGVGAAGVVSACAYVAKLAAMAYFIVVVVLTAEIFPTSVRNTGIGLVVGVGRLGSISAPMVVEYGLAAARPSHGGPGRRGGGFDAFMAVMAVCFGCVAIGGVVALKRDRRGQKLGASEEEL